MSSNKTKEFERIAAVYLEKCLNPSTHNKDVGEEMEIRFGDNNWTHAQITKIDYDNIVKTLISRGFSTKSYEGINHLRINCEHTDEKTGIRKSSYVRTDIVGNDLISAYCKTNSIQSLLNMESTQSAAKSKIIFTQKKPVLDADNNLIPPVNFDDHNFRVDIKTETNFSTTSIVGRSIITQWADSKKYFRHLNRVRLTHKDIPLFADLSIVQKSASTKNKPIMRFTIQEAGVFNTPIYYEIELEVNPNHDTFKRIISNMRDKTYTKAVALTEFMRHMRNAIRIITGALQDTMYPIGNDEQKNISWEYLRMVHGKDYNYGKGKEYKRQSDRVFASDFVGPSSVTLQLEHITVPNENSNVPNIRSNYCVTDKADGERKLLFINEKGRIYFIDSGMRVSFTGCVTGEKNLYNSLLDGEHIKHNKQKAFINLYAVFDIYYTGGKCVRDMPFITSDIENPNEQRIKLMNDCVNRLKIVSVTGTPGCPIKIQCKTFYTTIDQSIFECSNTIMNNDMMFEYETDGLIYTPMHLGVGATREGAPLSELPKTKRTWEWSFKWKPPRFNTVDFLITDKLVSGNPEVHTTIKNVVDESTNEEMKELVTYRAFILNCGFNSKTDGYLQPWQDILDNNLAVAEGDNNKVGSYRPAQFSPTSPYDRMAGICYIELTSPSSGGIKKDTFAESGEIIRANTIVEFKFDREKNGGFRWIPLRVRHDKTSQFLNGAAEYGNAFRTANSNWRSIHNPISDEMISTGQNIPDAPDDEDVYYADTGADTRTKGLRDFHNKYVKRSLILAVAKKHQNLIDFAVGRAGDLHKWKDAGLDFVFGIDIARANIEHSKSGACARYIDMYRESKGLFKAIFLHGTSAKNLRNGDAFATDKEKMIAKAVFGTGPKDIDKLGAGVFNNYGKGKEGFHVSSVQFALHYFFENQKTLHTFLRNVAECTRLNGYFIGTCYDGNTVFDMFNKSKDNSTNSYSITIMKSGHKIYELTKKYSETSFPDDEQSLGYAIDMYQESINKTFQEYLVNFKFLTRMMENYGFAIVPKEEANKMGLPNGSGMFKDLYINMMDQIKRDPSIKKNYGMADTISEEEKTISFMNRYFVFKKVRQILNLEKIAKYLDDSVQLQEEDKNEEGNGFVVRTNSKTKNVVDEVIENKLFIRRIGIHKFFITGKKVVEVEDGELPKKMTIRIPNN